MKNIYTLLLFVLITSCINSTKTSVTPKDYLDEVLKIVEEHSIRRNSVDFNEIEKNAYAQLENMDSIDNCYVIVKSILKELGDNHSIFLSKEEFENMDSTCKEADISEVITFSGKLLDQNIGYLHLKGFSTTDSINSIIYAVSLQNLIKSIDNRNIKGWILDLRENTGGNCWPMLAGLGPLLGNGICGYSIDNNHKKSSWFYKNGKSGIDTLIGVKINNEPYKLLNELRPIAVLTGYKTLSSGEVVVTAFHNKSNARSFGENTGGLSTGNRDFKLSDGSMIILTTAIFVDREGNIFGKSIEPDENIPYSNYDIGKPYDPVIKRAKEWMIEN